VFERLPDGRYFLPKIEFYITNVCNLNCEHCNRFNNHDFRGWQRWVDYEPHYAEWAKYIDFGHITILGGEPLLNPTIVDWVRGINRLWGRPVQILTNGTRLNAVPGLYDLLLGEKSPYPEVQNLARIKNNERNHIGISWHNADNFDELKQIAFQFLTDSVYKPIRENDSEINGKYENSYVVWSDDHKVNLAVWMQDNFEHSSLRHTAQGLKLHDNDPAQAHASCTFAINRNYHFIRGSLYKCGPVALLPEFDQQHQLAITDQDRDLLTSYQPLTVGSLSTDIGRFLDHINDPIPQCRFCPVEKDRRRIQAVTKNQKRIPINTITRENTSC
jgi:organic radical activating enzyme